MNNSQSRSAPLYQLMENMHTRAQIVCGATGSTPAPEALANLRKSIYAIENACIRDGKFKWAHAKAPKNPESKNVKVDRAALRQLVDIVCEITDGGIQPTLVQLNQLLGAAVSFDSSEV